MNLKRYILIFNFFVFGCAYAQTATLEPTFSLKEFSGHYIPYQNGMPVPSFEKQNRATMYLHGTWKKQRFTADDNITLAKRDSAGYNNLVAEAQGRQLSSYDDSGWEDKTIPGVENEMYPFPKVPEYYQDGVWYRLKFDAPENMKDKFVKLSFLAVNYVADVWLNDEYLGYHEGGYTPFAFDVSDKLKFNEKNTLAIRVDNPEWGKRNDIVPYYEVDWFNYAGIIHDVYLEASNNISVLRADVIPVDTSGKIQYTIVLTKKYDTIKNFSVSTDIYTTDISLNDKNTELASDLKKNKANFYGLTDEEVVFDSDSSIVFIGGYLKIQNPLLWSPKEPNLYILEITVKQNDTIKDQFYTQFGVRTVERVKDKVLLNGQPVFLTGVARHEDHPLYGRSIPLDTIYSDLHKVKGVNANFLRTAHYPNHPYTYQIADRLGISIMEEIPVWWFDEALPWEIQNNDRHIHEQMFKEMVYKDFNRPSILFWSTSNECRDVPNRKIFVERIQSEMKNKVNDGRLVTQSAAADRPGPEDDSQKACDVAGWTMYFGVFYGGTNIQGGTNNFLINAKVKQPETPVIATEFGTWSGEDNSLFNNQIKIFNETFTSFQNFASINKSGKYNVNGNLIAVTWWCIFDWYSHGHPRGYQSMGLYSMDRSMLKPVGQTLMDAYAPYYDLGGTVTEIQDNKEEVVPAKFELGQNYPNPFNPNTTIKYSIPEQSHVSLKVYNILGKEVASLVNEYKAAGNYSIDFNAQGLSSGLYFYRLQMNNQVLIKKMTVLK